MIQEVEDADSGMILDRRCWPTLGPDGGGETPTGVVADLHEFVGTRIRKKWPGATVHDMKHDITVKMNSVAGPRDFLEKPELFGRTENVTWKRLPGVDKATRNLLSVAYLQHGFACSVGDTLRDDGRTIAWLAEQTGLKERHLSHVLRGRQFVALSVMVAVVSALERIDLFPAPASIAELAP